MIGGFDNSILRRFRGWFRAAGAAMQAPGAACPCCGHGVRRDAADALGLCPACARAIPWIGRIRCPTCGRGEPCSDCARRKRTHFVQSRSAVRYDAAMKQLLARYKYRGDEALLALFARMLRRAYDAHLRVPALGARGFDCISYVPLSDERLQERGFNQAEQMARALAAAVGVPVHPLLRRVHHTGKMSFKSRRERLRDLSGVFAADAEGTAQLLRQAAHSGSTPEDGGCLLILLVDDVYTTGSTLNECASVVAAATGASVYGLTWAR